MAGNINRISTHVLDTASGKPAKGVRVHLEHADASGDWRELSASETDSEGRCAQMLPNDRNLEEGNYRLTFATAEYFAAQEIRGLYPCVQIAFQVHAGESHFHIPLLLSPNGYTTYRGT